MSVSGSKRPAVFLDRDGVINENRNGYVRSWHELKLLPGALEALARLAQSDYAIVIVTNQSGVARGLYSLETAHDINRRLVDQIEQARGRVDAVHICPHHPDDECGCRKPEPGMLLQASHDLNLDLTRSWLVGDALTDLQAARAAGVRPLLVRTGQGEEQAAWRSATGLDDVPVLDDLNAAVDFVLSC